ncbi:unnamed protein product [Meloidogyne enterolobii]|uniref:Uncharacterized protein n=1 Tax=Meloidogyne enterolobii TaxID=390850 RepID=A0ACB0ZGS1_MELEN
MTPSTKLLIISIFILFISFQLIYCCGTYGQPCDKGCCPNLRCSDAYDVDGNVVGRACFDVLG